MRSTGAPKPGFLLLVDDESELVGAIGTMLAVSLTDEDVRVTSDPREALGWVQEARPAVLISDARMPEVSGIELILSVQERWGPTPSILTTAFPDQHGFEPRGCGHLLCLPKPFSFFSLLEMIRKIRSSPLLPAGSLGMLANLLQLLVISSSSGVLEVSASGRRGEVHCHQGRLVHVAAGALSGAAAFGEIFSWSEGEIAWKKTPPTHDGVGLDLLELLSGAASPREAKRGRKNPRSVPVGLMTLPERLQRIEGFLGAALVDLEQRAVLGMLGGAQFDMTTAALGNCELVRAKRGVLDALGMRDEIEDILISLGRQYHLIRPLRSRAGAFFYLVLDRQQANLALARLHLAGVEEELGS